MPLPGTGIFHPHWSPHHRPPARTAMTATCIITRTTGPGTLTPAGDWTPPTAATIYTGPCRVVPAATADDPDTAGARQTTVRHYAVGVPWDVPELRVGDDIAITAARDPGLAGRRLRVADITYSSEQWQRNLLAEEADEGE